MRAEEVAGQVHVDDATPPGFVGLEEVEHGADDAGVVDQHVHRAEGLQRGVEHGGDLAAVGHVGDGADGRASGIGDGRHGGVDPLGIDVVDRHAGACTCEAFGDGLPYALAGAGNDDDLTLVAS